MEYIYKSALGVMFLSGLIKPFHLIELNTSNNKLINIYGYHYPDRIEDLRVLESNANLNVCVAHRYFEYSFSSTSLTRYQLQTMGYDIYCLGHQHESFPLTDIDNKQIVVRPGRFMRGTSHNYNLESSEVYVDVIDFTKDFSNIKSLVSREELPVKDSKEVFSTSSKLKSSSKELLLDLSLKVDELLNQMDTKNIGGTSVYDVMDSMDIDDKVRDRVEMYLKSQGILRHN